ncbi:MAG: FapA family protein [Ignavibacteriaceae bacterium]
MSESVNNVIGGRVQVEVLDQKMKATVCIKAPTKDEEPELVLQDVLVSLKLAGVKFGINEKIIDKYLNEKKWDQLFVAAEGVYPTVGNDAIFGYNFSTTKSLKPQITDNGHIDYKEINVICSANKDDLLVKKIAATQGTSGTDVFGNELPGKLGKDFVITAGSGTYKDPKDASIIKAASDGIIIYNEKSLIVEVQKLYAIPGCVDFSTGNVHVKSSVDVGGDVKTGFSITTPYDINVKGRIEHATIECEGNLNVKGGIVGDGKQVIKVGGDIHTGYIRDQQIICKGGVYAATEISGSTIESGDEVTLVKPDGRIVGGKIVASSKIVAGGAGNKYDVPTILEVGVNFEHRDRYLKKFEQINESHKQAETIKKKIELMDSTLPDPGMNAAYKAVKDQHKAAIEHWERMCADLKEIEKDYFNVDNPVVMILKTAFNGVTIKIRHAVYEVKQDMTHVMFRLNGDQIECSPIK